MRHAVGSSLTADTPVMPAASNNIVEVASPGVSLLPYFRGCPVPRWQAVPLLPPELNRQAFIPGNDDGGQILYAIFVEMSTQVLLCKGCCCHEATTEWCIFGLLVIFGCMPSPASQFPCSCQSCMVCLHAANDAVCPRVAVKRQCLIELPSVCVARAKSASELCPSMLAGLVW